MRLLGVGLLEGDLEATRDLVGRSLCPEGPTLDVPSRSGLLADLFAGHDYVGVDFDRADVDVARARRPGIYLHAPCERLDVPDGRFAQVLAFGLLDPLDDAKARRMVQEIARVTAPNGRLLAIGAAPVPARALAARLASRLSGLDGRRTTTAIESLLRPAFAVVESIAFRSGFVRRVVVSARRTGSADVPDRLD